MPHLNLFVAGRLMMIDAEYQILAEVYRKKSMLFRPFIIILHNKVGTIHSTGMRAIRNFLFVINCIHTALKGIVAIGVVDRS
jgi:hypothetical protein